MSREQSAAAAGRQQFRAAETDNPGVAPGSSAPALNHGAGTLGGVFQHGQAALVGHAVSSRIGTMPPCKCETRTA